MSDDQICSDLLEYIREVSAVEIDTESGLLAEGALDSFSILQVINFIEERFDLTIDVYELPVQEFSSVRQLGSWVQRLLGETATA